MGDLYYDRVSTDKIPVTIASVYIFDRISPAQYHGNLPEAATTMKIAIAGTSGLALHLAYHINEAANYAFIILSRAVSTRLLRN